MKPDECLPSELKPCPCGQIPKELCMEHGGGYKYAWVSGSCCNEWNIEFRTNYHELDSNECMELAVKAWNEAPRVSDGN